MQHPLNLPTFEFGKEPEWEIEEILDTRTTRRGWLFLVKWTGYTRTEWIQLEDMSNAPNAIVQYFAGRNEKVPEDVQKFLS